MLKKHTSNKINKIGTTTRVAKTIINNSNLIDAKQMAEKIGLLKKDIKQVREQNWLASFLQEANIQTVLFSKNASTSPFL